MQLPLFREDLTPEDGRMPPAGSSNPETSGAFSLLRGQDRPDLLREECLSDILKSTAQLHPEKTALLWENRTISYKALSEFADNIATALSHRGAAPKAVVGLFLPRGADLLIAQACITRTGAAWLPFDADCPVERVKQCLKDSKAIGVVTCHAWWQKLKDVGVPAWSLDELQAENHPHKNLVPAAPSDPAYVIYTSGSTGQPKGIVISHRSICHFLRSENEILQIRETDRVYQGFSVAFDMSFEEIWISYLVGASLWIAPPQVVSDPELLRQCLIDNRITVLHAVPTLISLIDNLPPGLRLLNLGGEACPEALANRLADTGLKVFNTYGPTETSVSATLAELRKGESVSIGMPLPNYGVMIVDSERKPVRWGETGELCIFGPGLAIGYLGQPDLTAQRFIPNPLAGKEGASKIYLTGDLARMESNGPVYCLGRVDHQVKIRGFRVELGEIAEALGNLDGVSSAAVVMRSLGDMEQLVAFLVLKPHTHQAPSDWRAKLTQKLPHYMVPVHFEVIQEMPRLISGKIDLNALGASPLKQAEPAIPEETNNLSADEAALLVALLKLFPACRWQPGCDFFDDLGGHSLLAARLVSILRLDENYASLSVQDVYRERTLARISKAMAIQRKRVRQKATLYTASPLRRRILCGLAQTMILPFIVLLNVVSWLGPFFVYHYYTGNPGDSIVLAAIDSMIAFVLIELGLFFVAIGIKRIVVGRLKPGTYPLWGFTYLRWWVANRLSELPEVHLIASTPWMPLYLKALGARIGRDVMIDTITVAVPELLVIEEGSSLGTFVNIENARVSNGMFIIGTVHLGKNSEVDSYSVLENDTGIGENSRLGGQSALTAGQSVPDEETWLGAPARRIQETRKSLPARPQTYGARQIAEMALFAASAMFVGVLFFLPTFPSFVLIDWIDSQTLDVFDSNLAPLTAFGLFLALAIPASALFLGATVLLVGMFRWILPRQVSGLYSIHSFAFWRKKFGNLLLDQSLKVLHGIYASVYARSWLRLLGANVGKNAEISTAEGMVPDLLTLGVDSFIADGALLGDEELHGGWMRLKPTHIGNRSFVGNGAYVQGGATVPDDVLIGVQTATPENEKLKPHQTWMGSPALLLPARECLTGFPESLTFRPSWMRRLARSLIEGLRIVLPLAFAIAAGYLIVILIMPLAEDEGWGAEVALALSVAGCIYGVASFLMVVAMKWLLLGKYKPGAHAMWTRFVWVSEAVTNLYESIAVPNFLDFLRGTPMLPIALRLLGTKIGNGVYMNTTDITEFDCVEIGDEAALNTHCGPQTHLFEDRIMKIGQVHIGARTTVGCRSTVLYNTHVGKNVHLGPLTLVAKGETLPDGTHWEGSPAQTCESR